MIPVPYPGTPIDGDASIVARDMITPSNPDTLLALKGAVDDMGLLDSDDGLRKGDLEELGVLWGKLKSLGRVAQDNGYVQQLPLAFWPPNQNQADTGEQGQVDD